MIDFRDELEEIDDVDESDLEVWEEFAEEGDGGEGLVCWDVAAGCEDDIGILTLVVTRPVPDSDTFGAVLDGFFHVEELEMVLFICYNDIDIVDALETVVCH